MLDAGPTPRGGVRIRGVSRGHTAGARTKRVIEPLAAAATISNIISSLKEASCYAVPKLCHQLILSWNIIKWYQLEYHKMVPVGIP